MADDDRRNEPRTPIDLIVDYEGAEDLVSDFTENLSTGGTFVVTKRDLAVDTQVKLLLCFPGLLERVSIEGTVRWTRREGPDGDSGVGIEFVSGPARDRLATIVQRIRDRDPAVVSRLFRVLVVEDNHHLAGFIEEGLRGSSRRDFAGMVAFACSNASDGRAAVEILRSEIFDALIIDVYLPGLDGPQVIACARTELGLVELPIIAVSAGGDAARESAMEAGASVFLDKPMRLRQLVRTIQSVLRF
jgi:uncharacterized protein (TIGR02266 family)